MNTCINCGLIDGYIFLNNYINVYENLFKIKRKSVYYRKYHLNNIINDIEKKNNKQINNIIRKKILKAFNIINKTETIKKRIINLRFILNKLFKLMELDLNSNFKTKNKKTLNNYEKFWVKVEEMVGDELKSVLFN